MREAIIEWYNGSQDYAAGVAIYAMVGVDAALLSLLQSTESEFAAGRLREELLRIYHGVEHDALPSTVGEGWHTEGATPAEKAGRDAVQETLHQEKVRLYKEMDLLRHHLPNYPSDQERGAAAHQILKLSDQISGILRQEEYYRQHATLPQAASVVTDPGMLKHRRELVGNYIRRYRSLLKKDPGNAKHREILAQYELERSDIQHQIDSADGPAL